MSIKIFKTAAIFLLVFIINSDLYSFYEDEYLIDTTTSKSENIYIRLKLTSASSIWQRDITSYGISLGFNDNEIGLDYRRYIGKRSSVTTYWLYEVDVILFVPVYTTIESDDVPAFYYDQINLIYSKLFRIFDWLSFNIYSGVGYGTGYERKEINDTTITLEESSGIYGKKYIKEYRCDIKENNLNSIAIPIGVSIDLDVFSWVSISLGYEFNHTANFNDESIKLDFSIFIFRD